MKKTMSLYIHIPFCNSKCNYCNFVSFVGSSEEKLKYIEALKKEIITQAKYYAKIYSVRTIYIGGGTPSSFPVGTIKDILQTIYKCYTVKNNAEITMELNPNTISEDKIGEYVGLGFQVQPLFADAAASNIVDTDDMQGLNFLEDQWVGR